MANTLISSVRGGVYLVEEEVGEIYARAIWNSGSKKKHHLDIKYPHVCFKCKKNLYWEELYGANYNYDLRGWDFEAYKRLKKLWRSKVLEFYCCHCYPKK